MRVVNHLPFVPVSVHGRPPLWFVLDTGAEATVLDLRAAQELGLEPRRQGLEVIGPGEESSQPVALCRLETLSVGAAAFGPHDACVMELDVLEEAIGAPFDGILGYRTFQECTITLDYGAGELLIEPSGCLAGGGQDVLPFLTAGGLPEITLEVNGRSHSFLIDTGSNETLAFPRTTQDFLPFKCRPVATHPSTSIVGRESRDLIGRLATNVRLGPHLLLEPLVVLAGGPGRIGGAILSRFRLTLDPASALVRFSRDHEAPLATGGVRSAGIALTRTADGWTVEDVLPGTPAERQGIRPGDLLLSVDGVPAHRLTAGAWHGLVSNQEVLRLVLSSRDRISEVEVDVVDLVE
jgi:predicted aspartyl protease